MNASNDFTHDVFLSHSSKDKVVVRELVERLRTGGVTRAGALHVVVGAVFKLGWGWSAAPCCRALYPPRNAALSRIGSAVTDPGIGWWVSRKSC